MDLQEADDEGDEEGDGDGGGGGRGVHHLQGGDRGGRTCAGNCSFSAQIFIAPLHSTINIWPCVGTPFFSHPYISS